MLDSVKPITNLEIDMKKQILPLLFTTGLVSTSYADFELPHSPSEQLSASQVNENLQALNTALNEMQSSIDLLNKTNSTELLLRMEATGEQITLLTQGSLVVKASCSYLNGNDSSSGRGLAIWTESASVASVVANDQLKGYYGHEGDTAVGWVQLNTTSDTQVKWQNYVDQGVTASTSGDVIIMDGESFGYGINIQGSDCLIVGNIISFKGSSAPDSFDPDESIPK